ncbi:hypothetical protein P1J78_01780 [Psychromarinibacter sp. C21-152]|uniref:Uncharacterized protein n=1 Tax=Psychromarinibacter sediminicola TaxID=3033385 RepID=A0AAE3T6M4_9RHOB|nr:hypothetical protein [Psychromarinibacter sediminicola]MDF0599450.1 hypothetical protein [Psychromarinibacter sediminicola]
MNAPETPQIERPALTLPPAEAAWLQERYAAAGVILEYGSGGSTVIAAELGKTVFSVESDRDWAAMMAGYFDAHPPEGAVHLHPVNIGPTGKWGSPRNENGWRNYHKYPVTVWDRKDFRQPDLVLIDGRFRAACLVATMIRTARPVTVLFDDYVGRKPYHAVERWIAPAETRGRMARFEVEPWQIPPQDLAQVLILFNRQQ